jgi:2-keto-3-deoxy-L-rhamnonate aldolase RhmA
MIGPDDLSQDLGVPGLLNDPKMQAATDRVIAVCDEKNIPWGFSCQDLQAAEKWLGRGIKWMPFANDAAILFNSFSAAATGLKKLSQRN